MPKPSVKEDLLKKGAEIILRQGFNVTGISDVAHAASAPKGSFYNHFESKEVFGIEILNRYFESFQPLFEATLDNDALTGAERLRRLIAGLIEAIVDGKWGGCLLGNFALDAAPQSELIRNRVNVLFGIWEGKMRKAIAAGQADGSIKDALSPDDAAAWFVAAWEGAVLRAKTLRNIEPLLQFKRAALTQFLT